MKFKLLILFMILLSCEEVPTPGGTDSGCTGNYTLQPYNDEHDIEIKQAYEHILELEFKNENENECIQKYHITRTSSNGGTISDVINVDEESGSTIIYSDDNAIVHGITYFYTVSGEDTYGNSSNNLTSNITPSFLAEVSNFQVLPNSSNQNLEFSWNFDAADSPQQTQYTFEIEWKNGDNQDYEVIAESIEGNANDYQWTPSQIEPESYYLFRIKAITSQDSNSDWVLSNQYNGTGINYPPVISEIDNQIIDEDTTLSIEIDVNDPNVEDQLVINAESNCDLNVEVYMDDSNTLNVIPNQNWNGSCDISITANDGQEDSDTVSFNLIVNPVNDVPETTLIPNQLLNEDFDDLIINLDDYFSDVDGDELTYTLDINDNTKFNASIENSELSIVSYQDVYGGPVLVSILANDNQNRSNQKLKNNNNIKTVQSSFNVSINPVNDLPVLQSISNQIMDEDDSISLQLFASDVDGDNLTFEVSSSDENVLVSTVGNILNITPSENWNGSCDINVNANDGQENSNTVSFNLIVNEVNDDPDATVMPNLVFEEDFSEHSIDLNEYFSDNADGDDLSYSANVNNIDIINVIVDGNDLLINSNPDQHGGPITVTVIANDLNGRNTAESSFNVNVTPVNDAPPVLTLIENQTTDEEETLTYILEAYDYDGDILTYQANCDADIQCSIAGSVLTVVPDDDYFGVQSIEINVYDGYESSSDSQQFLLTVNPVNNDSPVIELINDGQTPEEEIFTTAIIITDVDDNPSFTVEANASNMGITITEIDNYRYELKATPNLNYNGTENITVTVKDDQYDIYQTMDIQTFALEITYVEDEPTLSTITNKDTDEDEPLLFEIDANDPDIDYGDNLLIECTPDSLFTELVDCDVENNSFIRITTAENWFGLMPNFKVKVTDDDDNFVETNFDLEVYSINDIPTLSGIEEIISIDEDDSVSFNVIYDDVDLALDENEAISIDFSASYFVLNEGGESVLTDSADDLLLFENDILSIIPNPNFNSDSNNDGSDDTFIKLISTVTDFDGASKTIESEINVISINDKPEITVLDQDFESNEDSDILISFSINDVEDDNNSFVFENFELTLNNQSVIDSTNVEFSSNSGNYELYLETIENYYGPLDIDFSIVDSNQGVSEITSIDWVVSSVQDGLPNLSPLDTLYQTDEDTGKQISISANDLSDIWSGHAGYENYLAPLTFSVEVDSNQEGVVFAEFDELGPEIDDNLSYNHLLNISTIDNWNGSTRFKVSVEDNDNGITESEWIDLIVVPVNDPPEFDVPDLEEIINNQGINKTYDLLDYASDVDNDPLYFKFDSK